MAINIDPITMTDTKETTGNAVFPLFSVTVDPNETMTVVYQVQCQRVSDTASKSWIIQVCVRKNGTNAIVINNQLLAPVLGSAGDLLALLLADISVTADTDNVYFNIKGLSSTTIIWSASINGAQIRVV